MVVNSRIEGRGPQRRELDSAAYRLEAIHFLEYLKGNPKSKIKEVNIGNSPSI